MWTCLLQVQDCFIIDHKFQEYRRAFDAIDSSGDGTLNGSEISELFRSLGQPISPAKLAKLMEATDRDTNGRLDFFEFLGIFRHELLDLNKIEEFLKLRAAAPAKPRSRKLVEVGSTGTFMGDTVIKAVHNLESIWLDVTMMINDMRIDKHTFLLWGCMTGSGLDGKPTCPALAFKLCPRVLSGHSGCCIVLVSLTAMAAQAKCDLQCLQPALPSH